jgi:hypothetical protein
VAVADMNGDGHLDLVVANNFTSDIGVLLGDGTGNFTLKGNYMSVASGPRGLTIGDFNGDGHPDVAVTLDHVAAAEISVLLGSSAGDGSLGTATQYTVGQHTTDTPYGIASGDINGDGLADLAVALYGSTMVAVVLSQPGGNFAAPIFYSTGSNTTNPKGVAVGDLNGDGNPDIVVTNYSTNQIASLLNMFQ